MSDEVRERRACSGIPKNLGGSIKREHVAAFDEAAKYDEKASETFNVFLDGFGRLQSSP